MEERKALPAYSVWIGFDPRETAAFAVARQSIRATCNIPVPVSGIVLDRLRRSGLYWRPTEKRINEATGAEQLWDVISDAPMATEFSISRFLTPHLARTGWALFMDCDMLVRSSVRDLFEKAYSRYAVMCVKHHHVPKEGVKMDGQMQTVYARKNWTSFMLFNCDHPANKALTVDMVNELPGRDLHRLCWLDGHDDLIGELDISWNWLVGHSDTTVNPKNVHFTDGIPTMKGYENVAYSDEFRDTLYRWAHGER